jgi:hypothetical protein
VFLRRMVSAEVRSTSCTVVAVNIVPCDRDEQSERLFYFPQFLKANVRLVFTCLICMCVRYALCFVTNDNS